MSSPTTGEKKMCFKNFVVNGAGTIRRVGKEAKMKSAKPRRVDGQIKNENGKKELHRKKVRQRTNGNVNGHVPGQAVKVMREGDRMLYRLNLVS